MLLQGELLSVLFLILVCLKSVLNFNISEESFFYYQFGSNLPLTHTNYHCHNTVFS